MEVRFCLWCAFFITIFFTCKLIKSFPGELSLIWFAKFIDDFPNKSKTVALRVLFYFIYFLLIHLLSDRNHCEQQWQNVPHFKIWNWTLNTIKINVCKYKLCGNVYNFLSANISLKIYYSKDSQAKDTINICYQFNNNNINNAVFFFFFFTYFNEQFTRTNIYIFRFAGKATKWTMENF